MSEFSESFHLKNHSQGTAAAFLEKAGCEGYVYKEGNGWVTFLLEDSGDHVLDDLLSCNPGLLVHYAYAEDHGWELQVFFKDDLLFDYRCDWTDELQIDKNLYNLDVIEELVLEYGNSVERLDQLFSFTGTGRLEEPPAYIVADLIGLEHYKWTAAEYMNDEDLSEGMIAAGKSKAVISVEDIIFQFYQYFLSGKSNSAMKLIDYDSKGIDIIDLYTYISELHRRHGLTSLESVEIAMQDNSQQNDGAEAEVQMIFKDSRGLQRTETNQVWLKLDDNQAWKITGIKLNA